ncbi:MAG: filamentous hemagglutinin N-terminal domain-containing protein [Deltaproteobacteria bacterium]|nr:filamentous hemagglutinin N-terminal domain-containing protein [Deltaproteobacteria bacterium]
MKANRCRKRRLFLTANKLVSLITLIFFSASTVFALPAGQQVVNGQVSMNTQGNNLTITNSPNSIINWQRFSINTNEAVRFIQQSSTSAVLNRVIGQDPSRILGMLQSNGRVFLINPNGILFGQGARIDVNGLVASTLNISNQDFLAGKYNFTAGAFAGPIQNQGAITTPEGGKVYLIAPDVENSGIINSPKGDVILAAGHSVYLVDSLDPDISVVISAPEDRAINLGRIVAESGNVGIYGGLIQQKGVVSANSAVVGENGRIFFKAKKDVTLDKGSVTSAQGAGTIKILGGMDSGTVTVNGTLDASAPNGGDGGFIETSAAKVSIGDKAAITTLAPYGKTGTWLIDPTDFTIAASGGDMTGITLSTNLGSTDVTILSSSGATDGSGDINVNDTVSWTSSHNLTLSAYRNIQVNAALSHSGGNAASLTLTPNTGAGGGSVITGANGSVNLAATDSLTIAGNAYTLIGDATALQNMSSGLTGYYALRQNVDASATSTWNDNGSGGYYGFAPVGYDPDWKFTGVFDGLGHTVSGLYINRPLTDYVGLFGFTGNSSTIRNVGLVNVNINGYGSVGGLVGYNNGSIDNSYSTGTVTGSTDFVGGLVGFNRTTGGIISNSYSTGTVTGNNNYIGGLVGRNYEGSIINAYSTAEVTGIYNGTGSVSGIGGLVGETFDGSIDNSYSTGTVTGTSSDDVGGLVGHQYSSSTNNPLSSISNSYSTGAVSGARHVGGLVGYEYYGSISNSYSTGAVTGITSNVGGLVGTNQGIIGSSYSTGAVTGTSTYVGGLVGYNWGSITASYWDKETSGQATIGVGGGTTTGVTGLTTAQMMTQATFTGGQVPWDFTNTWWMSGANTRPFLRSEYSTTINNAHQLQLMGMSATTLGASYTLAANIDMSELTQASGLWNTATGFVPVGNYPAYFTGAFDGNGHTITGLTINRPTTDYVGLFGFTGSSSTIRNVGLVDVNIAGLRWVGGLAGENDGAIDNCTSTGTVSGIAGGPLGGAYIGGLVGDNYGSISKSSSTATVTGTGTIGGLVGGNNGGTISSSSHSTGTVTGDDTVGGLVGDNGGTISNSYSTGNVTGTASSYYVGGLAGVNETGGGSISNSYSTSAVIGEGWLGGLVGENGGTITTSSSTGTVTGTGDIIGGLVGGNYGTIDNNSYSTGDVTGNSYVGGLVGGNFSGAGISSSYSTGTVTGTGTYEGGTDSYVGGLVGFNDTSSTITSSYSTGAVTGSGYYVGGLVGKNLGGIDGSWNEGTVTGSSYYVGGLVGWNDGSIDSSYSTGTVIGLSDYVGGLAGDNWGTISDSYNTGAVIGNASSYYVGGLVGYNQGGGTISNAYNTGSVDGYFYVGGLAGVCEGGVISNSYNTGNVTGDWIVGGLVGQLSSGETSGAINDSYNTGGVSAPDVVGGLVGANYATISNSYSTGNVSGNTWQIGGLVGLNDTSGSITNSYSTGMVSGSGSLVGGLVGRNDGTISLSYWDTQTSNMSNCVGTGSSSGCTGLTTAQMTTLASFSGWDFETTWGITQGTTYPYLLWQSPGTYPVPPVATPQTISGMLDVALEGKVIYFYVDGTLFLGQTTTEAGGLYSIALSGNPVPSNSALLAYVDDASPWGASVYLSGGGDITNLLIGYNTLIAGSAGGTMSNTTLVTAKGGLTFTEIPYSFSGTNLTLSPNFNFKTAIGTTYSLNGTITTTNGSQTYNGPVTGAGLLSAGAANDITLTNASNSFSSIGILGGRNVTLTNMGAFALNASTISGTLGVTSGGNITQTGPLSVTGAATFVAGAGNNITLAGANDFTTVKITSGNDVALNDVNTIDLGASTVSGNLSVTATGPITQH